MSLKQHIYNRLCLSYWYSNFIFIFLLMNYGLDINTLGEHLNKRDSLEFEDIMILLKSYFFQLVI